jgi:hypothetical protein
VIDDDEQDRLEQCGELFNRECIYYDVDDLKGVTVPGGDEYRVVHHNIQSLPSKFDDLKIFLDCMNSNGKKPDFILLCETFLTIRNDNMFHLDGYNFECHNRTRPRGVGIYIKSNIHYSMRTDLGLNIEGEFESFFIEAKSKNHRFIVGEIYRVPGTNTNTSIERYDHILEQLESEKCDVYLGTDQNFDYAKINTSKPTSELFDTFFSKGYLPTITKATRITKSTATIIDNIYVKCKKPHNIISGVINSHISDHLPVFVFTRKKITSKPEEPLKIRSRSITDTTVEIIKTKLNEYDWNILSNMSSNEGYSHFIKLLTDIIDECAPEKEIIINKKNIIREKWMTTGLMKSAKTRDILHKKALKNKTTGTHWNKFIEYRNQFNRIKRIAKESYYKQLLEQYRNNIRKTWGVINTLIGKTRDKTGITDTFVINGKKETCLDKISNGFCKYFTNVGKNLAENIPHSKKHCKEYMNTNANNNSIYLTPTSSDEILKIITSLKGKKSSGHDGINSILLRKIKLSVCVPLTAIINKSLETGEVPSSLKLAKVVPIYKAKNKEEFNNYRPVSLLPCISKILEKVIHKRLYNFLLLNDVLYKSQYGFRPKHSTSNAITELSNDIITSLENKQLTLAVFLDLSKAFDTIDHMTLLDKLAHYGVRGVALEWFRSYLTNRRQYVQVNDNRSQIDTITYGVPQGSVLGPLLFIIYTNDLPRNLKTVKSILFADDTTIYQSSNNTEKLYKAMNEQLKILEDWFKANKLSLNASKTNYILFRNKNMELNDKNNKLLINGEEIVLVSKTKFLGIIIDEHLEWKEHIDLCKRKISSGNYVLKSLKSTLTTSLLTTVYYSMIHPYLSYGLMLWGSACKQHLHKIEVSQKKTFEVYTRPGTMNTQCHYFTPVKY